MRKTAKQSVSKQVRENKLSRQDYVALANEVGKKWTVIAKSGNSDRAQGFYEALEAIGTFLRNDNPRFDAARFSQSVLDSIYGGAK